MSVRLQLLVPSSNLLLRRAARQSARAQRAARQSASAAHELWPFVSVHLHKHLGNADALQESLCDLVIDQIG